MTDSEVARRADLAQPRYAKYVNDRNEPDLGTLIRICRVLATTPDELLGFGADRKPAEFELLEASIRASVAAMTLPRLKVATVLLDALSKMEGDDEEGAPAGKRSPRRA